MKGDLKMKKDFWNERMQDMTIGQSFLWLLLYLVFLAVVMVAMMLVPQHAEEIWDWIEDKYDKAKKKILSFKIFKKK